MSTRHAFPRVKVQSMDFGECIVSLPKPGIKVLRKFGFNATVGATEETIWDGSGVYDGYRGGAGDEFTIVSDDVADDNGGTGAITVQVYGLDADGNEQDELITLNGTGSMKSSGKYTRVFRAIVRTAGSSGSNTGTITIADEAATITWAEIKPLRNQTLMAVWTVPTGYTAFLTSYYANSDVVSKATLAVLRVRPPGEVFQTKSIIAINGSADGHEFKFPMPLVAGTDIIVTGAATGGGGSIAAGFDLWYELD